MKTFVLDEKKCARCNKGFRPDTEIEVIGSIKFGHECAAKVKALIGKTIPKQLSQADLTKIQLDYRAMMQAKTLVGMVKKGMFDVQGIQDMKIPVILKEELIKLLSSTG